MKLLLELCKVVEFQNKTNPGDLKTILDYVALRDFWYCSSPSYLQLSPKCLQLKHSMKDKHSERQDYRFGNANCTVEVGSNILTDFDKQ